MNSRNTYRASILKNAFLKVLNFLIFGNVWIALGASLMYLSVYHLFSNEIVLKAGFLQIFGATLFAYNYLRFRSIYHDRFQYSPIAKWMVAHKNIIYFLMIFGLILVFVPIFFIKFHLHYYIVFGLLIFLTMLYMFLRKYWWIKVPFIAMVWTLVTFFLPITEFVFDFKPTIFLSIAFFCFYQSITLPFEIRDIEYDKNETLVSNFALIFGIKSTKVLSVFFLILALLIYALTDFSIGLLFIPIFLLTLWMILKSKAESSEYLFTFGFDGLIVLWATLLFF